jgi:hypothetical protein
MFEFISRNLSEARGDYMRNFAAAPPGVTFERRRKPRIDQPFWVKLIGKDARGEVFEVKTVIKNISSSGVYVELDREVEVGANLSITVRISTALTEDPETSGIAAQGIIVRKEALFNEGYGVALAFTRRRFV